jgi:hypothetical protein
MRQVITAQSIGPDLIHALGLPKRTVGFTLRCYVGEMVKVECEYYPEDGQGLVKALSSYEVYRRAVPSSPPLPHFDTWMRTRIDATHRDYMARTSALPR